MRSVFVLMGKNLIWYIPLFAAVIFYLVIPNIASGYKNILIVLDRFSWLVLVSPAAAVFISALIASVMLPVQMMLFVPTLFDRASGTYSRRFLYTFGLVLGIVVACVILQIVTWGAFPLPVDHDGYVHVRMIPFVPWPNDAMFK